MAASSSDINSDLEKLRQDFEQFRTDVAALKDDVKGYGTRKATQLKDAAEDRLEELRGELERVSGELRVHGRATVAHAEAAVRDNPLTALAIAFAAGLLASVFIARR